jgi:hypothetical protein
MCLRLRIRVNRSMNNTHGARPVGLGRAALIDKSEIRNPKSEIIPDDAFE